MIICKKKLSDIIPADYNPRTITEKSLEGLERSIVEFGLVQPLIWNKKTNRLVGGHQRLKVLQGQGIVETDVIVVDLDDTKEKALNITLNNQKIQGEFDNGKLEFLLDEIKALDDTLFQKLSFDDFTFVKVNDDFGCEDKEPLQKLNIESQIIIEPDTNSELLRIENILNSNKISFRIV